MALTIMSSYSTANCGSHTVTTHGCFPNITEANKALYATIIPQVLAKLKKMKDLADNGSAPFINCSKPLRISVVEPASRIEAAVYFTMTENFGSK